MGTLTTEPYDVAEGQEWCDYFERLTGECRRLIAEQRMPDTSEIDLFLSDSTVVMQQMRHDITLAKATGQKTLQSSVPLTAEEHKRLLTISDSVLNLLLILEMRGAVELQRTEGVARVAAAIDAGAFTP
jgi:hypothetical protein